LHDFHLGSWG